MTAPRFSSMPSGRGSGAGRLRWTALAALLLCAAAHAALFDDEEARRQIGNLRAQVEAAQKAVDERMARIEAAAQDRRALVELAALIEALKPDIARLRGQNETLQNQLENIERRQRDLYVDLDTRLRRMEQAQSKLEQAQAQVQERLSAPEREAAKEKDTYDAALNQFRLNNFGTAVASFQSFISTYPASKLLPSAQYWIGNAHYALRDYKSAIAAQQKVIAAWPDDPKASDAMLNIASSQAEMNDARAARDTLQALLKRYPNSPAAEQAKQRLLKR